jgi:hypothetical protein
LTEGSLPCKAHKKTKGAVNELNRNNQKKEKEKKNYHKYLRKALL